MNKNKTPLHYGLESFNQAFDIALMVCEVLGHGKHKVAVNTLLETACVETDLGLFEDPTPNGAGAGLTQGDLIAIEDVATRTRERDREKIMRAFKFDIRFITPQDLQHSPLMALVFTRCFYKLIPEQFPRKLQNRAAYWKRYYNTALGKGTEQGYITKSRNYLYAEDSPLARQMEPYSIKDFL